MTAHRRFPRLALLTVPLLGAMASLAAHAAVITDTTFDEGSPPISPYSFAWPSNAGSATHGINANGTINAHNGTASRALFLNANFASATGSLWSAGVSTNQIPVSNTVTDRRVLSVGFDLWANRALPVRAIIRSYDANGVLTGRSERVVFPPIANSYYRHVLDVSEFDTAAGAQPFNPTSPRFELTVQIEGRDGVASSWPKTADNIIRIDNVSYTSPRFFVSNTGNNAAAGTQAQPLLTIQEAIRRAQPGDVIFARGGTYTGGARWEATARFQKAGTPSKWITLRAYPGETPVLRTQTEAWDSVVLNHEAAYVEVRGLTVRGNASRITLADAEANQGRASAFHNANGISVDARKASNNTTAPLNRRAHHIRIVDNTVYEHSGGGISALEADYVSIIDNNVYNNSWWTRYATSGISMLRACETGVRV